MKDTLIEIKNNLQGTAVEWMKLRIKSNDLEHKETKNNQSQQEEKKNTNKRR